MATDLGMPTAAVPNEPRTEWLSHSQIKSWTHCGEQFRLEKVVKVPSTTGWALPGGSAVHTMSEVHDLNMLGLDTSHLPPTFEEAFELEIVEREERAGISRDSFRASGRASKENPNKEDYDWWLRSGPVFVASWNRWIEQVPLEIWTTPEGTPAIELENVTLIGDNLKSKGYIDRILTTPGSDQPEYVVDLKSGSRKEDSPEQLGAYREDTRQRFGIAPPKGFFFYVRTGMPSETYSLNEFSVPRREWLYQQVARAKREGIFIPHPSSMCGSCGVRDYCVYQNGVKSGEIRPPWVSIDEWEREGGEA